MKNILQITFMVSLMASFMLSCGAYKKNIMLQVDENYDATEANKSSWDTQPNFTVQSNDRLSIEVFTNNGERVIDPDFELTKETGMTQANTKPQLAYLVDNAGKVRLPMVGEVEVAGLTLKALELKLQTLYSEYYQSPYVHANFSNKRVTVLGDVNAVVLLENENTHLLEVLSKADAINNDVNVQNIRVVRGEEVYLVDLSTTEGLKSMNMIVMPGDVVYVEPVRRPFIESVRDYGALISIVTSITAIIALLAR